MTKSNTDKDLMTSAELRELADLESLGLLEEVDAERFERAFAAATVAEQKFIRNRQATMTRQLLGTPLKELPQGLRDRVLAVIRAENERVAETLAPLASIGASAGRESSNYATESAMSTTQSIEDRRVRRAAVLWRAASFALMAAVLASMFMAAEYRHWAKQAEELASQESNAIEFRDTFGENLNEITSESVSNHHFALANAQNARGSVVALLDTDANVARLMVSGLAPGRYTVQRRDASSAWTTVTVFDLYESNTMVTLKNNTSGFADSLARLDWRIVDANGLPVAEQIWAA